MSSIQSESTEFIPRCKCCLKDGSLKSLWADYSIIDGDFENYGEMITECFSLSWKPRMDSDDLICDSCIGRLRDSFNFKREVLASEQVALEIGLNKLKHETNDEDYDIELIEEADDEGTDIKTESMDDSDVEYQDVEYLEEEYHVEENSTLKHEEEPEMNRMKYTEESLKRCITAVTSKGMTKDEAARVYNIPRKVITNKIVRRGGEVKKQIENMKQILKTTNATILLGHKVRGYICCFCDRHYQNPIDLKNHNIEEHTDTNSSPYYDRPNTKDFGFKLDITDLQCKLCDREIECFEHLLPHLDSHGVTVHQDVRNHIVPFKFDREQLRCVKCGKKFAHFKQLFEHTIEHYSNFECNLCDRRFLSNRSLHAHKTIHMSPEFKCSYCPREFSTGARVRVHEKTVHTKTLTFKCPYCTARFVDIIDRDVHLEKEHSSEPHPFKCKACNKVFQNQALLRIHQDSYHMLMKPYKCPMCDKDFSTVSSLNRHTKQHNQIKEFQCLFCFKMFGRRSTLKSHMLLHTNQNQVACEYCPSKFSHKNTLRLHMLNKHSDLTFNCKLVN